MRDKISTQCHLNYWLILFICIIIECVKSYGENCVHPCSPHCYNQTCDRFNGRCLNCCINGFHGELCNESKTTLFFFKFVKYDVNEKKFWYYIYWYLYKNFHAFFLINFFYMYQHTNMRFWFAVFDSFFIGHVMLKQIESSSTSWIIPFIVSLVINFTFISGVCLLCR